MSRNRIIITADGAVAPYRAGWGAAIRTRTQEWIAFGKSNASTSDDVEFAAVLQAVRLARQLDLLREGAELIIASDSARLIDFCRDRSMRVYKSIDWKRLEGGVHLLSASCLSSRTEIYALTREMKVVWRWVRRCSTPDTIKTHALSGIAVGDRSEKVVRDSGLVPDQLKRPINGTRDQTTAPVIGTATAGILYERTAETNVFTRKL